MGLLCWTRIVSISLNFDVVAFFLSSSRSF